MFSGPHGLMPMVGVLCVSLHVVWCGCLSIFLVFRVCVGYCNTGLLCFGWFLGVS